MTKFINRASNIVDFPFQDYCELNPREMETLAEEHRISVYNSWMLPQMVAYFGSWKVRQNSSNRLDATALGRDNIGKDPWKLGIWKVATQLKRSALVAQQNRPVASEYSTLVPLILSGLKKYQNLNYSSWDTINLHHMVDSSLYTAMTCEVPEPLSQEQLLEVREIGLQIKTGVKAGQQQKPTTPWRLTGIQGTVLGKLPPLAVTMLTQIWVAHPSLRSPYMVLDPRDWDLVPEPLISSEVLLQEPVPAPVTTKPAKSFYSVNDLPWA